MRQRWTPEISTVPGGGRSGRRVRTQSCPAFQHSHDPQAGLAPARRLDGPVISRATSTKARRAGDTWPRLGEAKTILIDGPTLAGLMVDHDIGVNTVTTYAVKREDSDYFSEE